MTKEISKQHEIYDLNLVDNINVKWVYGSDEHHAVDKEGNIYDRKGDKLVKKFIKPNKLGYVLVGSVWYNGRKCSVYAHTMVAETFICPKPSKKHQINHINENKSDNRLENLEWLTAQENCKKYHEGQKAKGIKHPRLKWRKKYEVIECDDNWNPIRTFTSIREAGITIAKEEGHPDKWNSIATQISYMISGHYGAKSVHGRKFKLSEDDYISYKRKTKKLLTPEELYAVEAMRNAAKEIQKKREQENNQQNGEVISEGPKTMVIHKLDCSTHIRCDFEVETDETGKVDLSQL